MEITLDIMLMLGLAAVCFAAGTHHGANQERRRASVMLGRFWMLSRFDGLGSGHHSLSRRVALREKISARLRESRERAAGSPGHR